MFLQWLIIRRRSATRGLTCLSRSTRAFRLSGNIPRSFDFCILQSSHSFTLAVYILFPKGKSLNVDCWSFPPMRALNQCWMPRFTGVLLDNNNNNHNNRVLLDNKLNAQWSWIVLNVGVKVNRYQDFTFVDSICFYFSSSWFLNCYEKNKEQFQKNKWKHVFCAINEQMQTSSEFE